MKNLVIRKPTLHEFMFALENIDGFNDYPMESYVLLDIVFPILFAFRRNGKFYLCYVLQFKTRKKFVAIISNTSYETLLEIVTQKKSINEGLQESITYVSRKLNSNNTWKIKEIEKCRLTKFLPEPDYFLTELIPNKVDLSRLSKILKRKLRNDQRMLKPTATARILQSKLSTTEDTEFLSKNTISDLGSFGVSKNQKGVIYHITVSDNLQCLKALNSLTDSDFGKLDDYVG